MKYLKHLILCLVAVVSHAADYYPPSTRFPSTFTVGTNIGVVGGIPTRTNQIDITSFGWSSGASAAANTAAFASALAASAEEDVIVIPAGIFNVQSLSIPPAFINRTVRGAGPTLTFIRPTSGAGLNIGSDVDYGNVSNPISTITAITRDSNVITVSDGSTFPTSGRRTGRLQLTNEGSTPVASVYGYAKVRAPTVVMVSRTGNNITLSQNILATFPAAAITGSTFELAIQTAGQTAYRCGFENLTVDGVSSGGAMSVGVKVSQSDNCWVKNVKVVNHNNYGIFIVDSANPEVRECFVDGGGAVATNHAGMLYNTNSYGLVEDNISISNFPEFEVNFASTFNVFAYNYLGGSGSGGILNINHGPHNSYNLDEGNSYVFLWMDGFFGGLSEHTSYRNFMRVIDLFVSQKRFSRNSNLVGNIVGMVGQSGTTDGSENWGQPNIGNQSFNGTSSNIGTAGASPDPDWNISTGQGRVWTSTLTTRTSDTQGVLTLTAGQQSTFNAALANSSIDNLGNRLRAIKLPNGTIYDVGVSNVTGDVVTFYTLSTAAVLPATSTSLSVVPSPAGYQTKDLDVAATAIRKGNYYQLTTNIPVAEALGADTLANSYFRTTTPAFFTSAGLSWPPYSPTAPSPYTGAEIPAGYRYFFTVPPEVSSVVVNSAGNQVSIIANKPLSVGAGGSGGVTITGGVTLTYTGITGSSINFSTSRVISQGETLELTYVQPGNGFEDSNGVDLSSFSDRAVTNGSQQESGATWIAMLEIADATGTVAASNAAARKQAVVIPSAGFITKVRIAVGANPFGEGAKAALLDTDNSTVLRSATLGATTAVNDYQVFSFSSYHVPSAGTYYIAFTASGNEDLLQQTIVSASGSTYSFTGTYASWPGATVPTDGTDNYRFSMGALFAPDTESGAVAVTGTTTVTGTLALPSP